MSLINEDEIIAGAVFFFTGSRIILNFLILYFLRFFLIFLRYFKFVLIIGLSNKGLLILCKVFFYIFHPPKSINCLAS